MTSPEQWTAPKAAHRLTHILDTYAAAGGVARFPVNVVELALGCAQLFHWSDPISSVEAANIPGFEGALFPSDERKRWLLLYNSSIRSPGRIRFTQAHELAHYILHRADRESFECTEQDMLNWSGDELDIETQADEFSSYLLMPLNDYRKQVTVPVDLDLLGHCAERYGVSLTAAILKWLSYTDEKAVVVVSSDGFMKWASSSKPAARAGAFFRTRGTPIPIPVGSLAADEAVKNERRGSEIQANVWFPHAEPELHLRELKLHSDQYESAITLLLLPRGATVWPPRDSQDWTERFPHRS
jgi:IrrE N-terminal-like domain